MKLIRQALLFWKLASEPVLTKEYYDNWLKTILPVATVQEISRFISLNDDMPYFHLEDIIPQLYHLAKLSKNIGDFISNFFNWGDRPSGELLTLWINDNSMPLTAHDFHEYIERTVCIGPNEKRQAQARVIKDIIAKIGINDVGAISDLVYLVDFSKAFTKEFLIKLAKHCGLNIYVQVMDRMHRRSGMERTVESIDHIMMKKPKLTVYDVARVWNSLQAYGNLLSADEFTSIIGRSDNVAHEYLRGFIYLPADGRTVKYDDPRIFILDSEMNPLNINYEKVGWPNKVQISNINNITFLYPGLAEKWQNIFNDFQVIPQ